MSERRGPERTCLGCRKALAQGELLRYALAPDGQMLVDYRGRLPGRGAYTCFDRHCLDEALRRRQFVRAFRREIAPVTSAELLETLAAQIRERIAGLIGMARKSQQLLSGSNLVLDRLAAGGDLALILVAADISDGIGAKVRQRATARRVDIYTIFDKDFLGRILGTAERSVVALVPGSLAAAIRLELDRLRLVAGEH